jgi:hypothetical protein
LDTLREFCREHKLEFHAISAATGEGVRELVRSIADALDKIPKPAAESLLELGDGSHQDGSHQDGSHQNADPNSDADPEVRTALDDTSPAASKNL